MNWIPDELKHSFETIAKFKRLLTVPYWVINQILMAESLSGMRTKVVNAFPMFRKN